MSIFIVKPVGYGTNTLLGGVAVVESSLTASELNLAIIGDTAGVTADIGWTTDSISDDDWKAGANDPGKGIQAFRVSGIGSSGTDTPTLSGVLSSELVSEYYHSNHSNSRNGNNIGTSGGGYSIDWSSMTITTPNEVISYDQAGTGYTTTTSGATALRSQSSNNDWYLNGVLFGSQSSGSGNEDYATDYWAKTDFQSSTPGAKDQVIDKISTNSDDILEFIVKKSLTQNQIRQLYVQLVKDEIIT